MRTEKLPQSAERFVPHRPPVLMLSELMSCNGEDAEAIASIPDFSPFCAAEILPRTFLVELLAQLVAAKQGYHAACLETPPFAGYLVGVREFNFYKDARIGDSLSLYLRRMNEVEGLLVSEGRVTRGSELLALGELRCFLGPSSVGQHEISASQHTRESSNNSVTDLIKGCMEITSMNAATGKIEAEICFTANSPIFSGHFPGRPIVPGVIWLEAGLIVAKAILPQQVRLQKIVSARFKKPIGPEERVWLELDVSPQRNGVQVSSTIISGKVLIATFELFLESP